VQLELTSDIGIAQLTQLFWHALVKLEDDLVEAFDILLVGLAHHHHCRRRHDF